MSGTMHDKRDFSEQSSEAVNSLKDDPITVETIKQDNENKRFSKFEDIVINIYSLRSELMKMLVDPRRDIAKECGYPELPTIQLYHNLYRRHPVANKVVHAFPRECWRNPPAVYEDEDIDVLTPFEKAVNELGVKLNSGTKSWYKEQTGSILWDYLKRADEISGIGRFGVLLIGVDDGLSLDQPAQGVDEFSYSSNPVFSTGPDYSTSPYSSPEASGIRGTDAQYVWPSLNPSNPYIPTPTDPEYSSNPSDPNTPPTSSTSAISSKPTRNITYLRVYGENLIQITQYEANRNSPRFTKPVMYEITTTDPADQSGGIGLTISTVRVHWTRLIHLNESPESSETFSPSRMEPVLNPLLDLWKLYGGSAEMYWKGAFPGLSIETHPSLGGDAEIEKQPLRDMMENYMNGLQRYLSLLGMTAKSLAPQVVDPSQQINVQLEAIAIQMDIPLRILKGSERGELASSEDSDSWDDRIMGRCINYLTPRLICPLIDRLILMKVLPEPENGYCVKWPQLNTASDADKANIALTITKAIAAYVTGGGPTVIAPKDFFTRILNISESEANEIAANIVPMQLPPDPSLNPASNPNSISSLNPSYGTGRNGNNQAKSGVDKSQYGRAVAPMHLPIEKGKPTLSGLTKNQQETYHLSDVQEIIKEFSLTDDEVFSLIKEISE